MSEQTIVSDMPSTGRIVAGRVDQNRNTVRLGLIRSDFAGVINPYSWESPAFFVSATLTREDLTTTLVSAHRFRNSDGEHSFFRVSEVDIFLRDQIVPAVNHSLVVRPTKDIFHVTL